MEHRVMYTRVLFTSGQLEIPASSHGFVRISVFQAARLAAIDHPRAETNLPNNSRITEDNDILEESLTVPTRHALFPNRDRL